MSVSSRRLGCWTLDHVEFPFRCRRKSSGNGITLVISLFRHPSWASKQEVVRYKHIRHYLASDGESNSHQRQVHVVLHSRHPSLRAISQPFHAWQDQGEPRGFHLHFQVNPLVLRAGRQTTVRNAAGRQDFHGLRKRFLVSSSPPPSLELLADLSSTAVGQHLSHDLIDLYVAGILIFSQASSPLLVGWTDASQHIPTRHRDH